jgi:hypothetical protein
MEGKIDASLIGRAGRETKWTGHKKRDQDKTRIRLAISALSSSSSSSLVLLSGLALCCVVSGSHPEMLYVLLFCQRFAQGRMYTSKPPRRCNDTKVICILTVRSNRVLNGSSEESGQVTPTRHQHGCSSACIPTRTLQIEHGKVRSVQ